MPDNLFPVALTAERLANLHHFLTLPAGCWHSPEVAETAIHDLLAEVSRLTLADQAAAALQSLKAALLDHLTWRKEKLDEIGIKSKSERYTRREMAAAIRNDAPHGTEMMIGMMMMAADLMSHDVNSRPTEWQARALDAEAEVSRLTARAEKAHKELQEIRSQLDRHFDSLSIRTGTEDDENRHLLDYLNRTVPLHHAR